MTVNAIDTGPLGEIEDRDQLGFAATGLHLDITEPASQDAFERRSFLEIGEATRLRKLGSVANWRSVDGMSPVCPRGVAELDVPHTLG